MVKIGKVLGFVPFNDPGGTSAACDPGYREALALLWNSLGQGRDQAQVKFSTIGTLRLAFMNMRRTVGPQTGVVNTILRDGKWARETSEHPTDSVWFGNFLSGMRGRTGEEVRQDMALTADIVREVLCLYEEEWSVERNREFSDNQDLRQIAEEACFFVFTYAVGLRGFEVPKIMLGHFRKQFVEATRELPAHMEIPLYGRFKGRGSTKVHVLMFVVQETRSGVRNGVRIKRLIWALKLLGIVDGWLYQDVDGRPKKTREFAEGFYEKLTEVYTAHPELFVAGVSITEDFGPPQSGRHGAATQTLKHFDKQEAVD